MNFASAKAVPIRFKRYIHCKALRCLMRKALWRREGGKGVFMAGEDLNVGQIA